MVGHLLGRAVSWAFELITPAPAVKLPQVVLPPSAWATKTTYTEMLRKRDAYLELRAKTEKVLNFHPETSGGEIIAIEVDPYCGDLLVTAQYLHDTDIVVRTHRINITEEVNNADH